MSSDLDEQQDEILALLSIFDPEEFVRNESNTSGEFRVSAELPGRFTVSLKQGETLSQYEISSLPPLHLTFELPEDYPSCSPPAFTLNCSWLTPEQLSSLTSQLHDLYQTTGGAVVLFSWAQFLKDETLIFLGITDHLEIPSNEKTTNLDNVTFEGIGLNTSAFPEAASSDVGALNVARLEAEMPLSLTPGQALLSQLLIHDAAQKEKAFSREQFECGVCFVSWRGSECVQLVECAHVFCRACLAEFCRVQIQSGNVREVTCAQGDCRSAPTPAQVRSLVGDELFSRYDRLLLQSTLDSMPDVVYCPRPSCASAVLSDSSSSMALCTVCSFAFCVLCQKTYHGTEDCYTPPPGAARADGTKGAYVQIPESQAGRMGLWDDYSSGGRERQKLLEDRYGRRTLLGLLESCLTEDWISVNSKNCPHCFSHIQKNGGCNFMTCTRCRRCFCWNCLAKSPCSDHFTLCPRYSGHD